MGSGVVQLTPFHWYQFLAQKPTLTKGTEICRDGDYFVIKSITTGEHMRISPLAALLLTLCDGSLSVEQLIDIVLRCGAQTKAELIRTVYSQMEWLVNFRMVSGVDTTQTDGFETPQLATVYLNITQGCNLRCPHCYIAADTTTPNEMSTGRIGKLMDEIAELSRPSSILVFSGGEPTMRRDLCDLLFLAKKKGFEVHLLTNGTLLSQSMARKLAPFCDQIAVSLDGSTKQVHEKMRGSKTYGKTIACIHMLLAMGINVKVMASITSINWADIPAILDIPAITPNMLSLSPFTPVGRGGKNQYLTPSNDQLKAVQDAIYARTRQKVKECGIESNDENKRTKGSSSCGVATRIISISSTGDVYPCHFFHHDDFKAGNVNYMSLKQIYLQAPQLAQFRSLRISEFTGCSTCPIQSECGGGCRASAFWIYGSVKHHDAICESHYRDIILERKLTEDVVRGTQEKPVLGSGCASNYLERR